MMEARTKIEDGGFNDDTIIEEIKEFLDHMGEALIEEKTSLIAAAKQLQNRIARLKRN